MFRKRAPVVETVMLWGTASTQDARRWVAGNAATAWVGELPGGWVRIDSVVVDGLLIGTSLTPQDALLGWSRLAPGAHLARDQALEGVRDGEAYRLDDEAEPPWLHDDDRPVRALVAVRGSRSDELTLLATADKKPAVAVFREGWTLVPHENALLVCEVFPMDESAPSVALASIGDELHLSLAAGGEVVAEWEWAVTGSVVGADRLPSGELGAFALELLQPAPPPVTVFLEYGFQVGSLERLGEALGAQGPAGEMAPRLVAALGLPDAVRGHLLGERYLEEDPDAISVQPQPSVAAAVLDTVSGMSRTEALTRTPARRAWGAAAGALFLAVFLPAGALMVAGHFNGTDRLDAWTWIKLAIGGVLVTPVAVLAVRRWWSLRGAGQVSPEAALPGGRRTADVAPRRWINRRGPATAISLVAGLALATVTLMAWNDLGTLRTNGVEAIATVTSVEGGVTLIEFMANGQSVVAQLDPDDNRPGDLIPVTYDPEDPRHVQPTADVWNNWLFLALGGGAVVFLGFAALLWWRVVDAQRIADWMN